MNTIWSFIIRAALCAIVWGVAAAQESADPLMRRDSTGYSWTSRAFTNDELRRLPTRTLEGLITLTPGITRVNSSLYARGSRAGEIEYRFGGVPVLDRWTNSNAVPYIPEMLENVTIHTGAYGPHLGLMGGGVVDMKLREGGESFNMEALLLTDDFARPGEQFLGTSSYGWTTAVLTLGAPLALDSKLFVVGEFSRQANRQPTYLEPINLTLDRDNLYYPPYQPAPAPLVIGKNHVPSQSADRSVIQWNWTTRYLGPLVEFFGSISSERTRDVTWPNAVRNFYRQRRLPWWKENTTLVSVKVSHEFQDALSVSGAIAYAHHRSFTLDPDLGESWRLYADSTANAQKGFPDFESRYLGPRGYVATAGFFFEHAGAPSNAYQQDATSTLIASLNARVRISDEWRYDVSAEAEWWTLRHFRVGSIDGMSLLDNNNDGVPARTFLSEDEERVSTIRAENITSFGYSFRGSESDGLDDGPRRPSVLSAAVSSTWQDHEFIFSAGVKGLWMDLAMLQVPRQVNSISGGRDWENMDAIWDYDLDAFRPGTLTTTEITAYALPHLSVQYVSDTRRAYASYGEYVETLPHQDLQLDDYQLAVLLDPIHRVPYNLGGPVITFETRPSRTSHVEIGASLQIDPGMVVSAAAYRKNMKGQVQMGRLPSTRPGNPQLVAFANTGASDATGLEVGLEVRRSSAIGLDLHYIWSQHEGYGSDPRSNREYFTDEYGPEGLSEPVPQILPLSYSRTHRLLAQLKLAPAEGQAFHGFDLRALARIETGTPYTKEVSPPAFTGSASVWTIGVRSFQDIRTFAPTEPLLSSRTPWIATVDLSLSYEFEFGPARVTIFSLITNLFDTKNVLNVYTTTGSPSSDGWLNSQYAKVIQNANPQYETLYRALNLKNRWAYMNITGNDIYDAPRQIRIGAKVEI